MNYRCCLIGILLCTTGLCQGGDIQSDLDTALNQYYAIRDPGALDLYEADLRQWLDDELTSEQRARIFRRLGDVSYDQKHYGSARSRYEQAIQFNEEFSNPRKSYLPTRLKRLRKLVLRQNLTIGMTGIYMVLGVLVAIRLVRTGRIRIGVLIRQIGITCAVIVVAGAGVISLDHLLTESVGDGPACTEGVKKPVLLYEFWGMLPQSAITVALVLTCVPACYALLYRSTGAPVRRAWLIGLVVVLSLALCGHYVLYYGFDESLQSQAFFDAGHVYFWGDIETEILTRPARILKVSAPDPNMFAVVERYVLGAEANAIEASPFKEARVNDK